MAYDKTISFSSNAPCPLCGQQANLELTTKLEMSRFRKQAFYEESTPNIIIPICEKCQKKEESDNKLLGNVILITSLLICIFSVWMFDGWGIFLAIFFPVLIIAFVSQQVWFVLRRGTNAKVSDWIESHSLEGCGTAQHSVKPNGELREGATKRIDQKARGADNLLFISEGALCSIVPLNTEVGDMFFTSDGIYFIAYATHQHSISYNEDGLLIARNQATEQRDRNYASAIQERVESFLGSLSFSKSEIDDLKYSEKASRLDIHIQNGKIFEFHIPNLSEEQKIIISSYPEGTPCYDHDSDPHGMFLEYPSPSVLLKTLQDNNEQVSQDILTGVSLNAKYVFAFYSRIKEADEEGRRRVGLSLEGTPEEFRKALCVAISKDDLIVAEETDLNIVLIVLSVIFGGLLSFFVNPWWLLLLVIGVIVGVIGLIVTAGNATKIGEEIKSQLGL